MLERLLRTYLHQDYDLRYRSVEDALRAFRADATAAERAEVLAEIDVLLASFPQDRDLYAQLRSRGFIFYPPRDGETTRAWLQSARALLEAPSTDVEDAEEDRNR